MALRGRPLFPMQEKILRLIADCDAPFDGPLIVESLLNNRELWFAVDFTDGPTNEERIQAGVPLENPQITIFAIEGQEFGFLGASRTRTWKPAKSGVGKSRRPKNAATDPGVSPCARIVNLGEVKKTISRRMRMLVPDDQYGSRVRLTNHDERNGEPQFGSKNRRADLRRLFLSLSRSHKRRRPVATFLVGEVRMGKKSFHRARKILRLDPAFNPARANRQSGEIKENNRR